MNIEIDQDMCDKITSLGHDVAKYIKQTVRSAISREIAAKDRAAQKEASAQDYLKSIR